MAAIYKTEVKQQLQLVLATFLMDAFKKCYRQLIVSDASNAHNRVSINKSGR